MRHDLQMLPREHRVKLSRAKLFRKIRGNTKHPLHTKINRRQRNGWTTEIQKCHRLTSRPLEEPTQLQRDDTTPWEQLPWFQRLPPARGGTAQRKTFHLANRSQLIHPGPSSSRSRFFMESSQLYAATLTHYSTEPLTTGPDYDPLLLLLR